MIQKGAIEAEITDMIVGIWLGALWQKPFQQSAKAKPGDSSNLPRQGWVLPSLGGTREAPGRQDRTNWTACEAPGRQERT